MRKDQFEPELKRHLGPVKAPDELWDRVQGVSTPFQVLKSRRSAWQWAAAVATAAVIAAIAGTTVWLNRSLTTEELAVRALRRAPEQMEFRSADLAELRTWVKAGTGLDVPFTGRAAPSVHLVGAHVTRKRVPTAEISYRVGDMDVTLAVSKADPAADGKHTFVRSGSYHGANFTTWSMRGQMYTIAAADARVGCLLCHSTGAPRTPVVN